MRAVVSYAIRLSRRNESARMDPGNYWLHAQPCRFVHAAFNRCSEASRNSGLEKCDSLPARVQGSLVASDHAGRV